MNQWAKLSFFALTSYYCVFMCKVLHILIESIHPSPVFIHSTGFPLPFSHVIPFLMSHVVKLSIVTSTHSRFSRIFFNLTVLLIVSFIFSLSGFNCVLSVFLDSFILILVVPCLYQSTFPLLIRFYFLLVHPCTKQASPQSMILFSFTELFSFLYLLHESVKSVFSLYPIKFLQSSMTQWFRILRAVVFNVWQTNLSCLPPLAFPRVCHSHLGFNS